MASRWAWSKDDPNQNSISGDITRLFRAEGIEQPGILRQNAPSESALLFAREAIQNSWDAALELRTGSDKKIPQFILSLKFLELTGDKKLAAIESMSLEELAQHVKHGSTAPNKTRRSELGLFEQDCLSDLKNLDKPLKLLVIQEQGAVGMYGSWEKSNSRMMFALNRVGYTVKMDGAGGSFGYGKAGLIQASRIRTLFAYSCFDADAEEPDVTRRFLGAAYWGQHKYKGNSYTGWVRLGHKSGDSARPFTNEEADEAAAALGIDVRHADKTMERGTTFLIVDPGLDPDELKNAIERNWWPSLLARDGLRIEILKSDGTRVVPKARKDDPVIGPFISAYECADKKKENSSEIEIGRDLGRYNPQGDERTFESLGRVGIVADPEGWSFPALDYITVEGTGESEPHKSLIALVRGPRMVVQYWSPQPSAPPYVRGVLIAHDDIDDLLRQTEPKAHDKWDDKLQEPGIDALAPKVAAEVQKRMKAVVSEFRQRFRPPPPPPGPVNLPTLDKLMNLLKGKKIVPPKPEPRPFTLQFTKQPKREVLDDGRIRIVGRASFGLSEHVQAESAEVELTVTVAYVEDQRAGTLAELSFGDIGELAHIASVGRRYVFRGTLTKSGPRVELSFSSEPYSADWTTQVAISGKLSGPSEQ
jgi:hypothetical protein